MRKIPEKMRKELAKLPRMKECIHKRKPTRKQCKGRITWDHAWKYSGRQINEIWAIVGVCVYHHLGAGLDKQFNQYCSIVLAKPKDFRKYPRVNWGQMKKYLRDIFDAQVEGGKLRTDPQNNALHKWCAQISEEFINKGITAEEVLKSFTMPVWPTPKFIKYVLVHRAIKSMSNLDSTTQLKKDGEEIKLLVDAMTGLLARHEIEEIPWPYECKSCFMIGTHDKDCPEKYQ